MKFEKITRNHIEEAAQRLKPEDVPGNKNAKKYTVHINGQDWPVKFIIQEAYKDAYGAFIGHDKFDSAEARSHLRKLNFTINENGFQSLDRSIPSLIESYIEKVKNDGNAEELYKWELVKKNEGKPDLNSPDFNAEIRSMEFKNLVYGVGIGAIRHLARDRTQQYKNLLGNLYDEAIDLQTRIDNFSNAIERLYREIVPETRLSHHHDERTVATLLTYKYPNKYTFFKDSFYQKLCTLLMQAPRPKQQKYVHYLSIIEDILEGYILSNSELLSIKEKFLNESCHPDPNHLILAQDILYRQLDNNIEEISLGTHSLFKISMGELKKEFEVCVDEQIIVIHSETAALASSKESQADVFRTMNAGDYFYLTKGNGQGAVTLIGRVISPAVTASDHILAERGYIQRKYEPVVYSVKRTRYNADKAWWSPNHPSTCVQIKPEDLKKANRVLFSPYFQVEFKGSETLEEKPISEKMERIDCTLNTILYGPPGTGKTYRLNEFKEKYFTDKGLSKSAEDVLRDKVTPYPFWKLLGAILGTASKSLTVAELVAHPIIKAWIDPANKTKPNNRAWAELQSHADDDSTQLTDKYRRSVQLFKKSKDSRWTIADDKKPELPDIIEEELLNIARNPILPPVQSSAEKTRYNFITFHQKYSYEDFIEGIKPLLNGDDPEERTGELQFELKKGVFYNSCLEALRLVGYASFKECYDDSNESRRNRFKAAKENQAMQFALFIDEINRANISAVFGELITLLEEDKRMGSDHEMWIELPYSNEKFCVPGNLYLIGSMNTADRSIALLDIALRRRFEFKSMYPDYMEVEWWSPFLQTLNRAIYKWRPNADFFIGHAYFFGTSESDKAKILNTKIIPLLYEYCQGNLATIQTILKEADVKLLSTDIKQNFQIIAE